jgi:hypothetical protein
MERRFVVNFHGVIRTPLKPSEEDLKADLKNLLKYFDYGLTDLIIGMKLKDNGRIEYSGINIAQLRRK